MPKRKRRRGLSEDSTDAKRKKEARRGPAAEHSVQASLDPAGRTLDVEIATDISLGGDPRECCEARVQSRNSAAQNRSPAHRMPTQLQVPSQMHAQKPIPEHSATSRDQEQVYENHKSTPAPHQMITRLRAACMGQDHPLNQPVQTSNGQYMPIWQGAACMAPEETTTQTSLTRSGWPRPSAPQKHSTAKQPSLSARKYDPTLPATTNLGAMSVQCASCEAKRWIREPASLCCYHGKVKLEPLGMPPEPLKTLYYYMDMCHFVVQLTGIELAGKRACPHTIAMVRTAPGHKH